MGIKLMTLQDWLELDFTDDAVRDGFSDWCEETGLIWRTNSTHEHWTGKPIHGKDINATSRMKVCKQVRKIARQHYKDA